MTYRSRASRIIERDGKTYLEQLNEYWENVPRVQTIEIRNENWNGAMSEPSVRVRWEPEPPVGVNGRRAKLFLSAAKPC